MLHRHPAAAGGGFGALADDFHRPNLDVHSHTPDADLSRLKADRPNGFPDTVNLSQISIP